MIFPRKPSTSIHVLFLAGLFAGYLFTLFGVAHLSDVGNAGHDAVRVAAALVELSLIGLVMAWPLRRWRERRRIGWFIGYLLLAAVVSFVYLTQIYSLYLSNNFVSVLGMQNLRYAGLTSSPLEGVIYATGAVWWGLLGLATWFSAQQQRQAGYGLLLCFAVAGLLYVWLFTMQRRHLQLEPDFRQVPLASMVVNAGLAVGGGQEMLPAPAASKTVTTPAASKASRGCFQDPGAGKVAGYPFQKRVVYRQPLPYPRRPGAARRPNVIVIFTEGLSARLLGAYGGPYPGLTPHIDRLARRSMKVTDYYNHTAATYRGLIGQNTSGFSFKGGRGEQGWARGEHARKQALIRRSSLADILGGHGYATFFFEPEQSDSPFSRMLRAIGFRKIHGLDEISQLLGGRHVTDPALGQVSDRNLFDGLVAWLRQRHARGVDKPFFAGLYNIGTHAFISMAPDGEAYAPHPNRYLNKVHTYDAALGRFLNYFFASPYARDTILVFTTDHATYPDKVYRDVAGAGLAPYFVDRIPLLIHDPVHRLPATLDAHARNSLDLAPTLLQLLGIRKAANSFLGASLFEPRHFAVGLTALGNDYYVTGAHGVHPIWATHGKSRKHAECERAVVTRYYRLEAANHLFTTTPTAAASASTPAAPTSSPVPAALQPHQAPPMGHALCALDTLDGRVIQHDGQAVRMPAGPAFATKGWLVDDHHRAVSAFDLVLKPVHGKRAHRFAARTGGHRVDVVKAIESEQALTSGFHVQGATGNLPPGRYHVLARGTSGLSCNFHVTVRVGAGRGH